MKNPYNQNIQVEFDISIVAANRVTTWETRNRKWHWREPLSGLSANEFLELIPNRKHRNRLCIISNKTSIGPILPAKIRQLLCFKKSSGRQQSYMLKCTKTRKNCRRDKNSRRKSWGLLALTVQFSVSECKKGLIYRTQRRSNIWTLFRRTFPRTSVD
jgi:hypothetical protein